MLQAQHRRMSTLANAAGVGVVNKGPLKNRFDHPHHGVMDDPIGKRRGRDVAGLGIMNGKQPVPAVAVAAVFQGCFQPPQYFLGVVVMTQHLMAIVLTAGGRLIGSVEVFETGNLVEQSRLGGAHTLNINSNY